MLIKINRQLLQHFRVYRGSSFINKEVYHNTLEPHTKILRHFQIRDIARAVPEINRHLEITSRDMETIHKIAP